ncbi:MAG TPA: GNAT family protein [Bacillales bacterium]|nr:GNAT family protein [Bacillales bacterium]
MFTLDIEEDLKIKQFEAGDAQDLYDLIESCRDYLGRWLTRIKSFRSVRDVEHFIETAYEEASTYKNLQTGIWYRGELAGLIAFEKIDWFNQWLEMGCWLGEKFQGKGIMTKATVAMMDYAYERLGFHRIEMRCGTGNRKSRAIPEKLGFREEGTFREVEWLYDRFVDQIIYGMTREEFQKTKAHSEAKD